MNCEKSLIVSAVFLVLGLGLILGFTHGTVGFGAAYPVVGTALEVSLKTTGLPALVGLPATLVGLVVLMVALVQAVAGQARPQHTGTSHPGSKTA